MLEKTKSFSLKVVEGTEITPEMLVKINKFALKTLAVTDVYVRKLLMAHNGIDRDLERFPEILLDDFVNTLPGKSFLEVHDKSKLPLGRYFDAFSEEMSKEKFKELTGEDIFLPEGMETVKVVFGLVYILKTDFNDKLITNLEAGIYRDVSIGVRVYDLIDVKNDNGQLLYREYVPPGEAREGSIVWLGAQPGATVQKQVKECLRAHTVGTEDHITPSDEKVAVKCPLAVNLYDAEDLNISIIDKEQNKFVLKETALKTKVENDKVRDTYTARNISEELGDISPNEDETLFVSSKGDPDDILEKARKQSSGDIENVGKKYREKLEKEFVLMRTSLGDFKYDEASLATGKKVVSTFPVDFLIAEVRVLEKRLASRDNPGQLDSKDEIEKMSISPENEVEVEPGTYIHRGMMIVPKRTDTPGLGSFQQAGPL